MPILIVDNITKLISNEDMLKVDFLTGEIYDKTQNKKFYAKPFSRVQLDIYKRNGLLNKF
jgi:hypothetical protein